MPILSNVKHERYCQAIAVQLLDPKDAYREAGYTPKDDRAAVEGASKLSIRVDVKQRLSELLNTNLQEIKKTSISSLHSRAVIRASELLESDNAYVVAGMIKTILERSEPVVKQTQTIRISVDGKERERREKLLEARRVKAVLLPPGK